MDMGIKSAKLETVEVEDFGDAAYEVGIYTLFGAKEQVLDSGKYVIIWKKDGDHWQLHRDIWTTSMPSSK
jgi:ketosteroid isomerase-like protein